MNFFSGVDWQAMWIPSGPLLDVVVRGSVMYLGLVVLFRLLRRDTGNLSLADLLLVVLISDAAQNGMAGEYRSVTAGLVLVGTIAGWSYLLDWLSYRFKAVARLLVPPPLPLVRDGVMQRRNLRRELISPEEIMSQLRQQGIARLEEVQRCYLEPDGKISVIKASRPHDS
jgi:uncharacterized membrane protein YcaP (DUF421 family)